MAQPETDRSCGRGWVSTGSTDHGLLRAVVSLGHVGYYGYGTLECMDLPSEVVVRSRQSSDPPGMLQAWVAELSEGVIAGHLALQEVSSTGEVGAPAHACAEVARLFVAPAARRRTVASALLDRAAEWVDDRGYRLTLHVVDIQQSAAIAFYESTGWRHTHTTRADWTTATGDPVTVRHYVR